MKSTTITIRISEADKESLRRQAEAAQRTMSDYIVQLIKDKDKDMTFEKLEELKEECIKAGINEDILVIWKNEALFINCDNKQSVKFDGKFYKFLSVGGSRYFYTEKFENAIEMADFISKNISNKTTEEINFHSLSVNDVIHCATGKIIAVDENGCVCECTEKEILESASQNLYKNWKNKKVTK